MSKTETFQLPPEFFAGKYADIAISRENTARFLSIIGVIDGRPALLLDGMPKKPAEHMSSGGKMVTRYYLYVPVEYGERAKWELMAGGESIIDAPDDPKESAFTYYGAMEFGEAMVLNYPIPYEQAAWDALMPRWGAELENRRRNGEQVN